MRAKIEVGTNTGSHTENLDKGDCLVFTFEPSPPLYMECVERFKNSDNIIVLPFAVDIHNDFKHFNVALQGDKGFGSLYEWHPNLPNTEAGKHPLFQVPFAYKQKVLTIRLDTFMNNWGIDDVEYLHIDAQGSDFNVIKSLGDRIRDVREGQCECTWNTPYYDGADNFHENVRKYLEEIGGFKVETLYEHAGQTEIDLRFYR